MTGPLRKAWREALLHRAKARVREQRPDFDPFPKDETYDWRALRKQKTRSGHPWTPRDGFTMAQLERHLRTNKRRILRVLPQAGVTRRLRGRWFQPFTEDEAKRIIRAFYIALDTGVINAARRTRVGSHH